MLSNMFQTDVLKTRDGRDLELTFIAHASLVIGFGGMKIYVDPVSEFADYSGMPKADLILITHQHSDHFDKDLVEALMKPGTEIITTGTVAEHLDKCTILKNGESASIGDWLLVEAIPAHNVRADRQQYHPDNGRDNGYLLTLGGSRIYISGDGEPTPEMMALTDIDVAFLAVNQPYTMTVKQAAEAALAIRPKIFYPYHFGRTDEPTDLGELITNLSGSGIDVRIRDME